MPRLRVRACHRVFGVKGFLLCRNSLCRVEQLPPIKHRPALSNMTTPLVQLEAWMTALERYARALTEYVAIVDDVAQKSRPAARTAYRRALDDYSFLSAPDSANEARWFSAVFPSELLV